MYTLTKVPYTMLHILLLPLGITHTNIYSNKYFTEIRLRQTFKS